MRATCTCATCREVYGRVTREEILKAIIIPRIPPTTEEISEIANIPSRTVRRQVAALAKSGVISECRLPREGKRRYYLTSGLTAKAEASTRIQQALAKPENWHLRIARGA